MTNVIVVMGPDNIGKTYLVKKLLKKYPQSISNHFGAVKSKSEGKKAMFDALTTIAKVKNKMFIFDRFPFGDFVYGPLFRKYDAYSYFNEIAERMSVMIDVRFLFIFLYADESTYEMFSLKPKKDEKIAMQKSWVSEKISVSMIDLANRMHGIPGTTRLVVNSNNYDDLDERNEYIGKRIEQWMAYEVFKLSPVIDYGQIIYSPEYAEIDVKKRQFNPPSFSCKDYGSCIVSKQHEQFSPFGMSYKRPTSFYGNITNPKFIFVGEAPGHLGCGTYGIPFYGDKSGYIFYKALAEIGIIHSEIYITNTVKCCPKGNDLGTYYNGESRMGLACVKQLDTELLALPKRKIIALGKVASVTLQMLKIHHEIVYHPAYYLRIGKPDKFTRELKEVLGI